MAENELKSCPFCGGKAEIGSEYNDPFECGAIPVCNKLATNLQQTCNKLLVQIAKNAYNLDFAEANLQQTLQVCKYCSRKTRAVSTAVKFERWMAEEEDENAE